MSSPATARGFIPATRCDWNNGAAMSRCSASRGWSNRRRSRGRRNALEAEVLDGLTPGQQVLVHPGDTIQDGTRIVPR